MDPGKLVKLAVEKTIKSIKASVDPTTALEKAARELNLNENFIQRAGEAVNVMLHYDHFKKHASDKAATFPIADIPTVTKKIYSKKENTKIASMFPTPVEKVNYNGLMGTWDNVKVASAISEVTEPEVTHSTPWLQTKIANFIDHTDKEKDRLYSEKVAKETYIEAAFNSLVSYFKKTAAARIPFHEFETAAFTNHGSAADKYVDLIYKAAELKESRGEKDQHKLASESSPRPLQILDSLVRSVTDLSKVAQELFDKDVYSQFLKSAQKTFNASTLNKTAEDEQVKEAEEEIEQLKLAVAGPTKSLLEHLYNDYKSIGKNKPSPVFPNTSRTHNERVRMMQDLMMTDPILAQQEPKRIMDSYQQVLRLSPQLSQEKEVVRSLLRQLTATQSLAPVEANQLIDTNTMMLKQQELLKKTTGGKQEEKK